jgi:hypothetical protein
VGMEISLIIKILNVMPTKSNKMKMTISFQHFFLIRGGISKNEIIAPVHTVPIIAHIGLYSSISF